MVVSLPGFPPFRPNFYEGDNSTEMWTMLGFAQRNYPDFPKDLKDLHAFDFDYQPPNLAAYVLIPAGVMLFLSFIVVGLRLLVRYRRKERGLGIDDWLIIAATLGAVAYVVVEVLLIQYGCVGRHCYDCKFSSMVFGYKFEYVSFVVYLYAILMTKLSILAFTWQLASRIDRVFRAIMIVTGIFITISTIVTFFMVTFNCNPIPSAWDFIVRTNTQYACYSMQKIIVAWSIIMAGTDLWLLLLPAQLIWRLRLPTSSKLGLTFIFSLGIFATIASFVKAQAAVRAYHTYDLTWHFVPILVGSHLEITLGLIAASLPALNSVLGKAMPNSWQSLKTWAYKASGGLLSSSPSGKEEKSLGYSTAKSVTLIPGSQTKASGVTTTITVDVDSEPNTKSIPLVAMYHQYSANSSKQDFHKTFDTEPPLYDLESIKSPRLLPLPPSPSPSQQTHNYYETESRHEQPEPSSPRSIGFHLPTKRTDSLRSIPKIPASPLRNPRVSSLAQGGPYGGDDAMRRDSAMSQVSIDLIIQSPGERTSDDLPEQRSPTHEEWGPLSK